MRSPPLWAMLTCALAALTLAHPALGGQFLVSGISDQYIAGHAFRDYAANTLRAGDGFPLWNPYTGGGHSAWAGHCAAAPFGSTHSWSAT